MGTVLFNEGDYAGVSLTLVSSDEERPAIGVSLAYTTIERLPIHQALWEGAKSTGHATVAITEGLFGLVSQMFAGTADYSQVAGPIGIAGLVGDAAKFGLTSLMLFTAMISLTPATLAGTTFMSTEEG